jgi:hypothetical protein
MEEGRRKQKIAIKTNGGIYGIVLFALSLVENGVFRRGGVNPLPSLVVQNSDSLP